MATGTRWVREDAHPVPMPIATAEDVARGDLVGISSNLLAKASDITWDTNLATTQAAFAAVFLGVSRDTKAANATRPYGHSVDNRCLVSTTGVYEFDCGAATFNVGDLVGPAKQSGDLLENQKVASVASESLAIGRVEEPTSGATRVMVRIFSTKLPAARQA